MAVSKVLAKAQQEVKLKVILIMVHQPNQDHQAQHRRQLVVNHQGQHLLEANNHRQSHHKLLEVNHLNLAEAPELDRLVRLAQQLKEEVLQAHLLEQVLKYNQLSVALLVAVIAMVILKAPIVIQKLVQIVTPHNQVAILKVQAANQPDKRRNQQHSQRRNQQHSQPKALNKSNLLQIQKEFHQLHLKM